jgi:predicted RecA/RadA family phage recombinase
MNIRNTRILVVFALVAMLGTLFAATNYVQEGNRLTLTWATTSPLANAAVVKGGSVATGTICGVALTGGATAGENVTVATKGVFNLPVTASSTLGNMAVGDFVFASVAGNVEVCTTVLSNVSTGARFGRLLQAVTASTTAGVYSTVPVLIMP